MITTRIEIEPHVAEYVRAKYGDPETGAVRFPHSVDIYHLMYDLMAKRPAGAGVDQGNLVLTLPDRREANYSGGKSPEQYNYISRRSSKILGDKMRLMMWAEFHEYVDEQKHVHGIQYKEAVYLFMRHYEIESVSEDAFLKNYQRWRDKLRRRAKRGYTFRKS